MNIDFLMNKEGDFGLVTTGRFEAPVSGVIFDHENLTISLEFGATMDSMTLNVPVDAMYKDKLSLKNHVFMVGTDKKHIHEAYTVPLLHVNDFKNNDTGEWA